MNLYANNDKYLTLENSRSDDLLKLAKYWDRPVRRELSAFARAVWPERGLLRRLGLHSYRRRKRAQADRVIWWIERDIPPYDRYRCEVYSVELAIGERGQVRLSVLSGEEEYPVEPIDERNLIAALILASKDDPMIVPRQMGEALDP
jgi:hypothetical protein